VPQDAPGPWPRRSSCTSPPSDDAVVKLLWLAICNIEDKRARDRLKERGRSRGVKRNAEGRLVEGQITTNWKQALAQLALAYPDRVQPYL
jgi:putative transposase